MLLLEMPNATTEPRCAMTEPLRALMMVRVVLVGMGSEKELGMLMLPESTMLVFGACWTCWTRWKDCAVGFAEHRVVTVARKRIGTASR